MRPILVVHIFWLAGISATDLIGRRHKALQAEAAISRNGDVEIAQRGSAVRKKVQKLIRQSRDKGLHASSVRRGAADSDTNTDDEEENDDEEETDNEEENDDETEKPKRKKGGAGPHVFILPLVAALVLAGIMSGCWFVFIRLPAKRESQRQMEIQEQQKKEEAVRDEQRRIQSLASAKTKTSRAFTKARALLRLQDPSLCDPAASLSLGGHPRTSQQSQL